MNFNRVTVAGHLTRNPELRYTSGKTAVANFGLAINERYKSGDKEQERVTFLDVTAWGVIAETIHKHLGKGDPIFIEGRLQQESWEDRETGGKRTKLIVVVGTFRFWSIAKIAVTPRDPARSLVSREVTLPMSD